MSLSTIFVQSDKPFSTSISEWATELGIEVEIFDGRVEEQHVEGLLLITENQDTEREHAEIYSLFYDKHIPTQRIDINGTLQVAINGFGMWLRSSKCQRVLVLGADRLASNDNLQRFLEHAKKAI